MAEKIITIPRGLSTSDFSYVGTWRTYNSTNRQYAFSDIRGSLIRNIVGGVNSVQSLCSSVNINPWAAFKPWKRGTTGVDHGMVVSSGNIIYDKPTGTSGYYLGDFAGYNHYAPLPGVITSSAILTYTTGTTKSFSKLITLPEFDLRTLNSSSIQGVVTIRASDGVKDYWELTDSAVGAGEIPISSGSITCPDDNTLSFQIDLGLGYMSYSSIIKYCNYPRTNSASIVAYNISPPKLYVLNRSLDNSMNCAWNHRHSAVANGIVRLTRSIDGGTYYNIYQGSGTSYNHSCTVGTTYRYKLYYQNASGVEQTSYSYKYIVASTSGGGDEPPT